MRVKTDKEVDNVKHSNIRRYIEQVIVILNTIDCSYSQTQAAFTHSQQAKQSLKDIRSQLHKRFHILPLQPFHI